MAKIYFDNHSLDLARAKIFNSLVDEKQINLFDVVELSSGDYLPKSKMEDGKYKVYGGGGLTQSTHTAFNVEFETVGIGRVGARCGCVFIIEKKSWVTDNALYVSNFKKKCNLSFLVHYLNHINLNQFANQSAQPVISQKGIAKCTIPDIEFYQQKQIGELLDAIEKGEEFDDVYDLKSVLKFERDLSLLNVELDQQQTYLQLLRQTILQEAVQGKLNKQDPTDEPATELLKRIKAEKEKLIKAGKLKKEKELPPITDDEIPFELPEGWVWCRLGEVIELISGQHVEAANWNDKNDGYPYLTGPSDFGNINPIFARWTKKPKVFAMKDDVLITVKGSGVGKLNLLHEDNVAIGRQLMAVRVKFINREFVSLFLDTNFHVFQNEKTGIAIPGISREDILEKVCPLPPLPEQERIVAKIQQLQQQLSQLEAQVQQSLQYAQQLLQSVLKEAFEGKEMEEMMEVAERGNSFQK